MNHSLFLGYLEVLKRAFASLQFPSFHLDYNPGEECSDVDERVQLQRFVENKKKTRVKSACVRPSSDSPSSRRRLWSCRSRPGSLQGGGWGTRSRCHPLADRWRTGHRSHGDASLGRGGK